MPRQPPSNKRETGTVLRSPRRQDDPSSPNSHNPRIHPLAQHDKATHEPQLGKPGNTHTGIPPGTTPRQKEPHQNHPGCEIIMGNNTSPEFEFRDETEDAFGKAIILAVDLAITEN